MLLLQAVLLGIMLCLQCSNLLLGLLKRISLLQQLVMQSAFLLPPLDTGTLLLGLAAT